MSDNYLTPELDSIYKELKGRLVELILYTQEMHREVACIFLHVKGKKGIDEFCTEGTVGEANVLPLYANLHEFLDENRYNVVNIQLMFHTHPTIDEVIRSTFGELTEKDLVALKAIDGSPSDQDLVTFLDEYIRIKISFDIEARYQAVGSYISQEKRFVISFVDVRKLEETALQILHVKEITSPSQLDGFQAYIKTHFGNEFEKLLVELAKAPKEQKSYIVDKLVKVSAKRELAMPIYGVSFFSK